MAGVRKVGDGTGRISEEVVGGDRVFGIPKVHERLHERLNTVGDYATAYKGLAALAAESLGISNQGPYSYGVPPIFYNNIRLLYKVTDDPDIQRALAEPDAFLRYWEYLPNYNVNGRDIIIIALDVLDTLPSDLQQAWIKNAQRHYVRLRDNGKIYQQLDILMRLDQQYWTDTMWSDALLWLDWGYQHPNKNIVAIVAARINPERWFDGPIQALRSANRVGAQLFFAMANMVTHGKPTAENIGWYFTDASEAIKDGSFVAMLDIVLPETKFNLRLFFASNIDVAIQAQEKFYYNFNKVDSKPSIIYFLKLLECIPQSLWTSQSKTLVTSYLEHSDKNVKDAAIQLLLENGLPD